jgi:hypothetical protein
MEPILAGWLKTDGLLLLQLAHGLLPRNQHHHAKSMRAKYWDHAR